MNGLYEIGVAITFIIAGLYGLYDTARWRRESRHDNE